MDGAFTAKELEVESESRANFRTYATGATITSASDINTNLISAGIAVSVNGNIADAQVGGNLIATGSESRNNGKVKVYSNLTQNMDGKFRGLLAAQSLAGAIGGQSGIVGFAGAVSIVVAQAQAKAGILEDAVLKAGPIDVLATDKSKIAVRAGALQAGGQNAGVGASFALIYAENEIDAYVGDRANITGESLSVAARKIVVNEDDYEFPLSLKTLFTVNVPDDDSANKGIINLNISDSNTDSKVGMNSLEVNLSTDRVMQAIDMLNYLASVNYYMEAIAGSIAAGADSKVAIGGAMAMLFTNGKTGSRVGEDASITLTGDFSVNADSENTSRMLSGSLAASNATGVGANIAALDDRDVVTASVGDRSIVRAKNECVKASAKSDTLSVTVAAAATAGGQGGGATIGGGIDVIVTGSDVKAHVGDSVQMIASGDVKVLAENVSDLLAVSTSVAGATGSNVAVGGTFAAIVGENKTEASIGANALVDAAGSVIVDAKSRENLINVLASLSGSTGQASAAGTLGVLVALGETQALIGDQTKVYSATGSIEVLANGEVDQIVVMAAATGSAGQAAVGATVNVGVFEHQVRAVVGKNAELIAESVSAGKNVVVLAQGDDETILVTFAGAASSGVAISGTITTLVGKTEVAAEVQDGTTLEAGDTIVIYADLEAGLYDAAGAVAIAAGNAGVGATVSTMVVENTVHADLGSMARAIAHASQKNTTTEITGGYQLPNRGQKRRGVVIGANANARILWPAYPVAFPAPAQARA